MRPEPNLTQVLRQLFAQVRCLYAVRFLFEDVNVGLTATLHCEPDAWLKIIGYHQRATRIEQIDYWFGERACAITKPVKPAPEEIKNLRFEVSIFSIFTS